MQWVGLRRLTANSRFVALAKHLQQAQVVDFDVRIRSLSDVRQGYLSTTTEEPPCPSKFLSASGT